MAWTTPPTYVTGQLMTAAIGNAQWRDNLLILKTSMDDLGVTWSGNVTKQLQQSFRGLAWRTHPDNDKAANQLMLLSLDEGIFNSGVRMTGLTLPMTCDITVSGAGGLDTGARTASKWYELWLAGKGDGNPANTTLLLHRAKEYSLDQSQQTTDQGSALGNSSANTSLGQGFQTAASGLIEFIDIPLYSVVTPTGKVWIELRSNSSGLPGTTVLATSDKLDASKVSTDTTGWWTRFVFRTPFSATASTQYHYVVMRDFAINGTNYLVALSKTGNPYANGVGSHYDGATWTSLGGSDMEFRIYVTVPSAALTYPSGYTEGCKLGYIYNGSGNTLVTTVVCGRRAFIGSTPGSFGGVSTAVPTLIDMSAIIPPAIVELFIEISSTVALDNVGVFGVPDGYSGLINNQPWAYITIPTANAALVMAPLPTSFQGVYLARIGGTGTTNGNIPSYIW